MGTDSLITAFAAAPPQIPVADNIVLEDFGQSMVYRGREAVIAVLRAYFGNGFPNGRMRVHTTLSGEHTLAIAFTFYGRHDGIFMAIPATGREVAVPMITLCRVAHNQVEHIAWYYDAGTLLRQLGLVL